MLENTLVLKIILGLYAAAQELDIPWTIIKGVSNYADGGLFEPNPWKKFASLMAASLTAHILSNPIAFKDWPHYQSTGEYWILNWLRDVYFFPLEIPFSIG